jgi:hypothetical protein
MAKESGNRPKAQLKTEIARSRDELSVRLNRVREEMDLPKKIRRSVRREPVPWIIGAVAVGLIITGMVTRRKKIVVDTTKRGTKTKGALLETGFLLGALRIAATLLKPVVMNAVHKKFGGYVPRERSGPKGF